MPNASGLAVWFRAVPAPMQGAMYMTVAALGFSVMNVLVRLATNELHPFEVAFFRNAFALLFSLPWLFSAGVGALRTAHPVLHLWRGLVGMAAMMCWFSSIALLPLGEAVALNFTVPLFATAGAAIFLGEVVRIRRWAATAIGFLGVLVILRPGFADSTPAMALPIVAAVFMAASVLLVKTLSRTEHPSVIVLYMNLILTPLSLVPALFVWQWPSWPMLVILAGLGLFATLAHQVLTRSYTKADASAVIPFDYFRLPFITVMAFFAFGEVPTVWIWPGAAIIAGATIYIARREARVARQSTAGKAPQAQL